MVMSFLDLDSWVAIVTAFTVSLTAWLEFNVSLAAPSVTAHRF